MKNYLTLEDIPNLQQAVDQVIALKKEPYSNEYLGRQKTLGMLFFVALNTHLNKVLF